MRELNRPCAWLAYFCATAVPTAMVLWFCWRTPNNVIGMYANFDGIWAAWNLQALSQWGEPFDLSPFNPLSGLGSMFLPNLAWLNPGALPFLLPMHRDVAYVLSYGAYILELAASCLVLYRAIGLGTLASVVATQLVVLVLAPPWSGYFQSLSWISLAPVNAHLFAICNFGVAALLGLGKKSRVTNATLAVALLLLAASAVYSAPVTFLTYVPVYFLFAAVAVAASRPSWRELTWKGATLTLVALLAWRVGVVEYLSATAAFSARAGGTPPFLWAGFDALKPAFWREAFGIYDYCARPEVLFCWKPRALFLVHMLGLAGALAEAARRSSPFRALAWAFLALVVALHVFDLGAQRALFGPLHVLSTPYHWWASYPFLFIFAGALLWRIADLMWRFTGERAAAAAIVLAPFLLPAASYTLWKTQVEPHLPPRSGQEARGPLGRPRLRAAADGEIATYLQQHASIAPGKPFLGYTATYFSAEGAVARSQKRAAAGPRTVWTYIDAREELDRRFGAMFQDMDLWSLGVPTLEEYGQWISKQAYHAYQLGFAMPEDLLSPLILRMVRADFGLLQRLGVRFVIADAPVALPGAQLRARQGSAGFGEILLYELPAPNLANAAVLRLVETRALPDSIAAMKGLGADPKTAVSAPGVAPPGIGPYVRSELRFERDGFRLVAESATESAVVLPVQYSHCWKIAEQVGPEGSVRLERVEGILTLARFRGRVEARFRLDFGPPSVSRCRLADVEDYARLSGAAPR